MSSSQEDALKLLKSTGGRVYYKVHKWTGSPHEDASELLKSISGRAYYKVHMWTGSSYKDALKSLKSTVGGFITKSTSGWAYPMKMP